MTFIISANSIVKAYGPTRAVDDISLEIPEGSIFGLLGPNGAGKTTLIRMITTITRPDSGTLLFKGQNLSENHSSVMGYMPEERGLYKKMSVLDQLLFFAEIKGMTHKAARENALYWLKRLDMETWTKKKMEELSKGMAQKVQFLCTIIHKPELIILDEPFSGFDPVNADLVKELILELKNNGATILFSTHRMDNVEELCDNLCIIVHGKVKLYGKTGGLRRQMFRNQYQAGYLQKVDFSNTEFIPDSEEIISDGRYIYTFTLKSESERESLAGACFQKPGIVLFTEMLPGIHEIFVNTVKGQINA